MVDVPVMPDFVAQARLRQTLALLAAIAAVGALAPLTPVASWAALALYLLGSLVLLAWRALGLHEAEALFLQGPGLRASLLWGGGLDLALLGIGLIGLPAMRAAMADGTSALPLEAVKTLLFGRGLALLLPLLVLAEEGLWRGLLLSGLLGVGITPGWAVTLSTLAFGLNHLAVAPLALVERCLLALMALPLGLIAARLTLRTRCLWGAALLHLLVIGAMLGSLR
jgi:membrane protease YdiL (CAAX protease family)